jgi:hypothetical protein
MIERLGFVSTGLERYIDEKYDGMLKDFVADFNATSLESDLSVARLRRLLDDEELANKRLQIDISKFVKARSRRVFNNYGQLKCRNAFC